MYVRSIQIYNIIFQCLGTDGGCNGNKAGNHATKISRYEDLPTNCECTLQKAVGNQPLLVTIDAGGFDFPFYWSGVLSGECGANVDHGGRDDDRTNYWLVGHIVGGTEEGYMTKEMPLGS
ncbi:cysteine endopeptidase RepA-like [Diospyros lotus]|uniref:cysteine endopeptidase RepA-like n=1 Tax=Diospyros lotus TaxID=55363 RepID=UPI002258E74F|nr:cysteine endopeptidase RepA-like [Diospyros lotus]